MTPQQPPNHQSGPGEQQGRPPAAGWLRFLDNLQEISRALTGKIDLDATLAMVAERAAKLVNAESAGVGLIDWEAEQVNYLYCFGKMAEWLPETSHPLIGTSIGSVVTVGQSVAINNVDKDERTDTRIASKHGIKSLIHVPLKLDDAVVGVLSAFNRFDGEQFDTLDTELLAVLANHAAAAVDNAQLYSDMMEALRKADAEKNKLEAILDNLGDGVVVCDADGCVILANEAAEVITGISADDVIGNDPTKVLPRIYAAEVMSAVRGLAGSKREDGMYREMTIALDTGKTVRVNIHPVFAEDGQFSGTAAVLQDITRTVRLDKAKTEFISVVAHELKTPLTALKGSIGLVLGGAAGEVDPTLRHLLDIAQNNCNRLIRLVDDMLDIAKIEADRFSLRLNIAAVQDCVRRVVHQMQQFADERDVKLKLSVVGKPPMLVIDIDRIEQVVTNLLSNAIKFAPSGSEVTVTVKRVHGCVRVSVTDSGPGIGREDQQKVFEKFYQGGEARRYGGSGLGLSISKAIVEQHGGTIYVNSSPGKGCTFAFLIPVPGEEALVTVKE